MNFTERLEQAKVKFINPYHEEVRAIGQEYVEKVIKPFCERYGLKFKLDDQPFSSDKCFWITYEGQEYPVHCTEYYNHRKIPSNIEYPKFTSQLPDEFWEELDVIYKTLTKEVHLNNFLKFTDI
jgi:hypothetical protein